MLKWLKNKSKKQLLPKNYKSNIDVDALKVVETLQKNRFESYLVGGCVRDLFLGLRPKDFDVATSATPQKVKNLINRSFIIGRRFRIVIAKRRPHIDEVSSNKLFPPILRGGKVNEKEIEITTFRRKPEMQGEKINENVFGSAKDDAFRRDFTVNGLFLDPHSGEIVDFVGGVEDLKTKKLRIIGDPKERFLEDPIRILRAIRFCVRSNFTLESKTEKALKKEIDCLADAKPERVREEILKFLKEGTSEKAFRWLWDLKAWKYLSPTWTDFLENNPKEREYFFKSCGKIKANDWHQSFGSAPLFYIFLLSLTTLPKEKSAMINKILKATAEELKISKIEKEEIQILHKSLKNLLHKPDESFRLSKKTNFILRQIQFSLTLSFMKDIDSKKWGGIWKSHQKDWLTHLEWITEKIKEQHSFSPKRPRRKKAGSPSGNRGRKPSHSKTEAKTGAKTSSNSNYKARSPSSKISIPSSHTSGTRPSRKKPTK